MNAYKTTLFLSTILLILTFNAFAQPQTSVGIKAGANFFNLYGDDVNNTGYRITPTAGIFLTYSDETFFGLTAEAQYIGKGANLEGDILDGSPEDIKLSYIEVPVFANFFVGYGDFRPKVFLGPTFGFLINAESDLEGGGKADLDNEYETLELGALVGTGFHYQFSSLNWFYFDVRYGIGFTNVSETQNDVKNNGISLNLGVSFPLTY